MNSLGHFNEINYLDYSNYNALKDADQLITSPDLIIKKYQEFEDAIGSPPPLIRILWALTENVSENNEQLIQVQQCMYQYINIFSDSLTTCLIKDFPLVFLSVLHHLNTYQTDAYFNRLTSRLSNWPDLFEACFQELSKIMKENSSHNDFTSHIAYEFALILTHYLNPEQLEDWMLTCYENVSFQQFAYLLSILPSSQWDFSLSLLDFSEDDLFSYLQAIVQAPFRKDDLNLLLDKILLKYSEQGKFNDLITQFDQLNLHTQSSLICRMNLDQQVQILTIHSHNISFCADLSNQLFQQFPTFLLRKKWISNLFNVVKVNDLELILTRLIEKKSQIGAYLLCFPEHVIQKFLSISIPVRTKILQLGCADLTTLNVLKAIQTASTCFRRLTIKSIS